MARPESALCLRELEKLVTRALDDVKKEFNALPPRLSPSYCFQSVQGVGTQSEQGKRPNMEDDEIVIEPFAKEAKTGFFALYDGHGGRATVNFVVKVLHMNLEQQLLRHPDKPIRDAWKEAYLITDGQLRRQNILQSGSTSVSCIIRPDTTTGKRWLYTANVGDSRAVLCRGSKAIRLTVDHKASVPEEQKRISDAGGFIGRNRVNGVLAVSRALGDHMLKENDVVTAIPYTTDTELQEDDHFLILACDGVWDVMTDQEAADFVQGKFRASQLDVTDDKAKQNGNTSTTNTAKAELTEKQKKALNATLDTISKALVQKALDAKSLDNITCMIIRL
jgi:serine/threonine protein phosphatase PrpC